MDFQNIFGTSLQNIFELTSNEYDYKDQSSYAFDLNADASKLKIII